MGLTHLFHVTTSVNKKKWQARRDSNPHHPVLETGALTVGATGLCPIYFVSRWDVCARHEGQNFLNSNRSGVRRLFFVVV